MSSDWVRIKDPSSNKTHHAFPHREYADHYVTECNVIVTTKDHSFQGGVHTDWVIVDQVVKLTCDDCLQILSMHEF